VFLVLLLTAITATPQPEDAISFIGFGGMALWVLALFTHQGIFAKCWRCRAALHLSPIGWYVPVVTWRRCPGCGQQHSERRA
jgi:hypothetical protein